MVNRIGRTMITITSHDSIHSFEIAPGPITTSVRKEAYEYKDYPFSYSREALGGRLEVYDYTGRLVYSWQRAYSCMEVQQQSSPVLSQTPSSIIERGRAHPPTSAQRRRSSIPPSNLPRQILPSNRNLTAERSRTSSNAGAQQQRPFISSGTFSTITHGGPSVEAENADGYSAKGVQQQQPPIAPSAPQQTFRSGTSLNAGRASQNVNSIFKKRKRPTGAKYLSRGEHSASAPRGLLHVDLGNVV